MTILVVDAQEERRLERILAVIGQRIESLQSERSKGSADLIEYRKYMWEDAALFDRAEMVQNENMALTQERAVLDVGVKLKRLRLLSFSPYFGRIDFREREQAHADPVYIGLHCLFDDAHNLLIYDWRAPVSNMFYDYEIGPAEYMAPEGVVAGDLLLKRQYRIENGRMNYMLDCNLAINDAILQDTLARNTSEKMRQIVNSIQKEQNAIIRDEQRKVLVVQGPAGSGKTSIAMHRAAYLLYRHRGHVSANNLLIFSPNEVFADYISSVLPELGEENIREATFEDYARSILGRQVSFEKKAAQMEFVYSNARDAEYAIRTASISFKSSPAFLRLIRSYARYLAHNNIRFKDIQLGEVVLMRAATVEKLYKDYCSELPLMPAIERLKDRVLAKVTYSSLKVERKIERLVEGMVIQRDPIALYRKLFREPALIKKLVEDEPLPDNVRAICRMTFKSMHFGKLCYEDIAPILLLKRLIDGEPRYANIRHLIIDEAQDYTPVHFEILRNLFGDSSMTILGDLSQAINPYSNIDDYEALKEVFGRDMQGVVELTKSYRSSLEITEFARAILPDAKSAENVRSSGRKPVITRASDEEEIIKSISGEIDRLKEEGMVSIAVICKTAEEAFKVYSKLMHSQPVHLVESDSITFHHGLVALPVYLAKGLEFDAVIIHDAGEHLYGKDSERKLLYTACTRALHSLTLYYSGKVSPLLPVGETQLFDW